MHDHRLPRPHHDLRLAEDGVLRSWALPNGLPTAAARNRLAIAVPDHDLDHLTYEDATKTIADTGWWELEDRDERRTVFVLHGRTGPRRFALVRTRGSGGRSAGPGGLLLHLTSQQPAG
ncbi:DNA polymerase ligase N-terminal domain-containing protein [Kineococcus endophyticus]|uniref:DNA polymerase ligase N-terminal domain-containing protein n=1 Tax=Kineococcus endophyticus TaxID=1181883 RepID=A0ABV3PAY0_9ACTN